MWPQFELSPGPLLKSDLGPLARYGTHQETVSGTPKQKHLPSDPKSELPAEGPLFKPALHAFISFKLPILTDKNLNITLLPRKSEKRCKRETS